MGKVINFGCRLNACESDIITRFVEELGIIDYTVINTCAVTAEAERQLRQEIRRLYKQNPDIKIILTGCAAQLHPDDYMSMDGVVGIISNGMKLSKEEYIPYGSGSKIEVKSDIQKVRGFLQIQNACYSSFFPKAPIHAMSESSCSCDALARNLSTSFLLLSSVVSELSFNLGSESIAFCFASLDI